MKKILVLIISISILFLSSCSANLKQVETADFEPQKTKLNLVDNQALLNYGLGDTLLTSSCKKEDLFDIEEIKISDDIFAEKFLLIDKDVYAVALDYETKSHGLYSIETKQSKMLYRASENFDILDALSKDGKVYFVEQNEKCENVLKCYSPAEKSIKKFFGNFVGKYYRIYDCGDYIAFAVTDEDPYNIDSYNIHFVNVKNGEITKKSFTDIDICPTHLIKNNYFVYRDVHTGSIAFFDIDKDSIVAAVSIDDMANDTFPKAKIIKDSVILSDACGIYTHSLSKNKTSLVYKREKIDWTSNPPFYLVGSTVIFYDNEVLCATDCNKNKSVKLSTKFKVKCTNSVDCLIIEDDSGKIFKYIIK